MISMLILLRALAFANKHYIFSTLLITVMRENVKYLSSDYAVINKCVLKNYADFEHFLV